MSAMIHHLRPTRNARASFRAGMVSSRETPAMPPLGAMDAPAYLRGVACGLSIRPAVMVLPVRRNLWTGSGLLAWWRR